MTLVTNASFSGLSGRSVGTVTRTLAVYGVGCSFTLGGAVRVAETLIVMVSPAGQRHERIGVVTHDVPDHCRGRHRSRSADHQGLVRASDRADIDLQACDGLV